jgi:hypothetical protein
MSNTTNCWKGRIVAKRTYEERLTQQKSGEKRRKNAIALTPSEETVQHNASTYVEEKPNVTDRRHIAELNILDQQLWCFLQWNKKVMKV